MNLIRHLVKMCPGLCLGEVLHYIQDCVSIFIGESYLRHALLTEPDRVHKGRIPERQIHEP